MVTGAHGERCNVGLQVTAYIFGVILFFEAQLPVAVTAVLAAHAHGKASFPTLNYMRNITHAATNPCNVQVHRHTI